ncbi:putative DNA repair protein Rad4 [Aspergillus avenaceus]|uniref:Putative DNA repair protein Rad4 n=1 Tax=Aspergillus avenaceus TaxID=36643 RepID=A0A5N6U4B2_ASPAV|nr:putative DNA repair protein Rad4 [Aspergillus avenaceus]
MRRTTRSRSKKDGASPGNPSTRQDDISEVYREMLAEAEAREPRDIEHERPIKRRKVQGKSSVPSAPVSASVKQEAQTVPRNDEDVNPQVQTVYDSPTSDDESDMEWEEVDLEPTSTPAQTVAVSGANDETLQITLDQDQDQKRRVVRKRKPITGAERKLRLDIHKVHLLCLLQHVQLRNLWCNDEHIQAFLKQMLSRRIIAMLNPSEDKPEYMRSTTFIDGLNQASEAFSRRFRVTKPGLRRPQWEDEPSSLKQRAEAIMFDAEVFLSKDDFQKQAESLQGSRDFGAQLFCALLRSAAVEARLVCSLQPLPFSGSLKPTTPSKPERQVIVISSDDQDATADHLAGSGASETPTPRTRRLGRPQFKNPKHQKTSVTNARPSNRESSHPVFWVEAFNEGIQKWVPVDPLVTKSLAKSFKFEPSSSDPFNCMSYVVAFEEDASARDVTRRYTKAFNAKTRKLRVESTKNGEGWWARVMQFYEKPFLEDRDEKEISELTAKTAAEPMPRNMQDFKDHPIYALERHLRRHEVIFPKRVVGQVGAGRAGSKSQTLEPIYRRSDVYALRSANKWYRLGRDVKLGEQPLKRVLPSRQKVTSNEDDDDTDLASETPLYAYFQTELYKPPPVVQGRIPRNAYGNLDVYVPSMVPSGGVHVKHSDASRAARILGIDYADAVTSFDFKGRHGTAVFQGIVIASEYHEALRVVLDCLEDQRLQAESEQKSAEALRLWKHFLLKLRIAERVKSYAVEGDEADHEENALLDDENFGEPAELGGGFIPEADEETVTPPQILSQRHPAERSSASAIGDDDLMGGGFIPDMDMSDQQEIKNSLDTGSLPQHADKSIKTTGSRYSLVVIPGDRSTEARTSHEGKYTEALAAEPQNKGGEEFEHEEPTNPRQDSSNAPISVEATTPVDTASASVEVPSQPPSQIQPHIPPAAGSEKGSESNDDNSLLSHDPEDEDAIPEWLMSD